MRTNAPCAWQGSVASFLAAPEEQLLSCLTSYVLDNREFVRDMKKIIHDHRVRAQTAPRERVVVFDEAQRAWDHDRVLKKHRGALTDGEPTLPAQIASHVKRRNPAIRDPAKLRLNAYRVLLTRGRDGVGVFVPPGDGAFDASWKALCSAGVRPLE